MRPWIVSLVYVALALGVVVFTAKEPLLDVLNPRETPAIPYVKCPANCYTSIQPNSNYSE